MLGSPGEAGDREVGATSFASVLQQEIDAGHVPGGVIIFGGNDAVRFRVARGFRALAPEPAPLVKDTIFDLASLTKVVATATSVMQLVETGQIALDAPVADYWPAFARNGKAAVTVRQLLTHMSGLPADLDLVAAWSGEGEGLARAAAAMLVDPPGTRFRYSDINFIVLGELVRLISGERLDIYAQRHIFAPLGMRDTGFLPSQTKRARIAATDHELGELRWGKVQDPTAYRMGGVAGHAGLFSTAGDLARFARMILNGGALDGIRILKPETVALMTAPQTITPELRRGLGWDISSPYSAGMDRAFGPASFGHTGYTGCLLWIDPRSRTFLVVMTSRLYPDGRGDAMALRRELARRISLDSDQVASVLPRG